MTSSTPQKKDGKKSRTMVVCPPCSYMFSTFGYVFEVLWAAKRTPKMMVFSVTQQMFGTVEMAAVECQWSYGMNIISLVSSDQRHFSSTLI